MTQKFEGNIKIDGLTVSMPSNTSIPPKKEWFSYSIWEFNGKVYRPITALAVKDLENAVKTIEAQGKTKATKPGKIKPTSIEYAIRTTGVENFEFI